MASEINEELYCMMVSRYRLCQGMALYYSLKKFVKDIKIFILCIDEETEFVLKRLEDDRIILISASMLEDNQLKKIKTERSVNAYCWTLKPVFLEYILKNNSDNSRITYLDADLFFFSEPSAIFLNNSRYSVLLSKHDFSKEYKSLKIKYGKYNSGLISFKNDLNAKDCLNWWKDQCLDFCSERPENNRYGDQKYLEQIPLKFKHVCDIKTIGVNIAPWNQLRYSIENKNNHVFINNKKLVCYHFSGFRLLNDDEFSLTFDYNKVPNPIIYKLYLQNIAKAMEQIRQMNLQLSKYCIEEKERIVVNKYKVSMFNENINEHER